MSGAVELIIGRQPTTSEHDGVWALTSPEVYLLLVQDSGWSNDEYEVWMAETLEPRAATLVNKGRATSVTTQLDHRLTRT